MSNKAILIIDIQEDYTGKEARPPFPYEGADVLIEKVNSIIDKCVEKDIKVIYIKQEFADFIPRMLSKIFSHGTALKGNKGTAIDKRIKIVSDKCFSKQMPSAFTNPELKKYLLESSVKEIYIVGLDGQFCVNETTKSAVKENYKVTIIRDAVLFRNKNKIESVINDLKRRGVKIIAKEEFNNLYK